MRTHKVLFISTLALGLGTSQLYAQDNKKDFYPHSFIGIQGGLSTIFYNNHNDNSPMGAFEVGRYYNPTWGLRGKIYSWKNKVDIKSNSQKMEYKYLTSSVDLLMNVSTLVNSENSHPLDLVLFAGGGLAYNNASSTPYNGEMDYLIGSRNNIGFHLNAGAQLAWRINRHFNVNMEVGGHYLGDRMASKAHGLGEWQLTTLVGLTYKIKNRKRNVSNSSSANAMQSYYNNQNANLAAAQNPNAQARPDEQEAPKPEKKVVKETKVVTETKVVKEEKRTVAQPQQVKENNQQVFFSIGSSAIRNSESSKLKDLAEWLKAHPDAKVVITGYADAGTGTPAINMSIAKKRANSIARVLTQKYGISKDRVSTESKGDTEQPYAENNKNRVVIAVAK